MTVMMRVMAASITKEETAIVHMKAVAETARMLVILTRKERLVEMAGKIA